MSSFLVTGGAGFVGSHLVDGLIARGHTAIVLDDLSSGARANLAHIEGDGRVEFVHDSVKSAAVLQPIVDRVDGVFHLAATVGVFNIIESPVRTISNNIGGTEAVLEAAARRRCRVLVASTSEVYGKSTATPFREDGDVVLGPSSRARWSYATSKLADEFLALAYWKEHQVPTVVARLFNTIGPRQSGQYGMVAPRFIGQALAGEPLTIFGSGRQKRCFTSVRDVVEWMFLLMENADAAGEVFNLGNPGEVSIEELAHTVIRLTGSPSEIRYVPYDQAYDPGFEDMERRVPDISKVCERTGYRPRFDLETILLDTIAWFRAKK